MSYYDQWKTASPYDDEPDPIEEAENWLERHPDDTVACSVQHARTVIEMLLALIRDEL